MTKWQWLEGQSLLSDMRVWHTTRGDYSWVIVLEERMGSEYVGWTGYSISWKYCGGATNRVIDLYSSFEEAENACIAKMKELTR